MVWLQISNLLCRSDNDNLCVKINNLSTNNNIILITGPNGSGKTTLGKVISGLLNDNLNGLKLDPTSKVTIFDKHPKKYFNKNVCYVPQGWKVQFIGSKIDTDIKLTSFWLNSSTLIINDYFELFLIPLFYRNRNPLELSRGERQRIALAMGFAMRSKVIFLDEPDAFLDNNRVKELCKIIDNNSHKTKVIISTHHPEFYKSLTFEEFKLNNNFSRDFLKIPKDISVKFKKGSFLLNMTDSLKVYKSIDTIKAIVFNQITFCNRNIFVIRGENGSGKTTLLRSIFTHIRNVYNTILISDEPDDQFIYTTVDKELEIHGSSYAKYVINIINMIKNINTHIPSLSWGYKKLLSIATGMNNNIDILLLDEPFSGLDNNCSQLLMKLLNIFNKEGRIVILTSNKDINLGKDNIISLKLINKNNTLMLEQMR